LNGLYSRFGPAAGHEDFRGQVTKRIRRPGETIHVFARNMGPVDRPVRTGEKAPIDPVARHDMACYLHATGTSRVQAS
jgi:hypothetical protein